MCQLTKRLNFFAYRRQQQQQQRRSLCRVLEILSSSSFFHARVASTWRRHIKSAGEVRYELRLCLAPINLGPNKQPSGCPPLGLAGVVDMEMSWQINGQHKHARPAARSPDPDEAPSSRQHSNSRPPVSVGRPAKDAHDSSFRLSTKSCRPLAPANTEAPMDSFIPSRRRAAGGGPGRNRKEASWLFSAQATAANLMSFPLERRRQSKSGKSKSREAFFFIHRLVMDRGEEEQDSVWLAYLLSSFRGDFIQFINR